MHDILEIRNLCISAKAFRLNGKSVKESEKICMAENLTFILGHQSVEDFETPLIPDLLKPFDFILKSFNDGIQSGFEHLEVMECTMCQDINVDACHYHDM